VSNTAYLLVRPFVLAHYLASEAYKGVLRTCAELPPTSCCNASRSVSEPLEMCNAALQAFWAAIKHGYQAGCLQQTGGLPFLNRTVLYCTGELYIQEDEAVQEMWLASWGTAALTIRRLVGRRDGCKQSILQSLSGAWGKGGHVGWLTLAMRGTDSPTWNFN